MKHKLLLLATALLAGASVYALARNSSKLKKKPELPIANLPLTVEIDIYDYNENKLYFNLRNASGYDMDIDKGFSVYRIEDEGRILLLENKDENVDSLKDLESVDRVIDLDELGELPAGYYILKVGVFEEEFQLED